MTRIIEVGTRIESATAEPVVTVNRPPEEQGFTVERWLTVHGERAFGQSSCGTCALLFHRLPAADAYLPPEQLRDRLSAGLDSLDPAVVEAFTALLGPGGYLPMLLEITPRTAEPGGEHDYFTHEQRRTWLPEHPGEPADDPGTPYYRLDGPDPRLVPLPDGRRGRLFEFAVPLQPPTGHRAETTDAYARDLARGATPTAVAVGVLNAAGPAGHDEQHWGLIHYLLDGHHKLAAAARTGRPLRLLSLLALRGGNTAEPYAAALPALLDGAPAGLRWPGLTPSYRTAGASSSVSGRSGPGPRISRWGRRASR